MFLCLTGKGGNTSVKAKRRGNVGLLKLAGKTVKQGM